MIPESRYEASKALNPGQSTTVKLSSSSASQSNVDPPSSQCTTVSNSLGSATDSAEGDIPSISRAIAESDSSQSPKASFFTDVENNRTRSKTLSNILSGSSTPAVKEFFAKHIQIASHSNKAKKRPFERVRRLQYGERLTGEECLRRMEEEAFEKKRKETGKVQQKRGKQKHSKKSTKDKTKKPVAVAVDDNSGSDDGSLEALSDVEMEDVQTEEVEKCEACGKVDDNTNSDQFIGCDICPNWFCKSVECCGIDLPSFDNVSTINLMCSTCQDKM